MDTLKKNDELKAEDNIETEIDMNDFDQEPDYCFVVKNYGAPFLSA